MPWLLNDGAVSPSRRQPLTDYYVLCTDDAKINKKWGLSSRSLEPGRKNNQGNKELKCDSHLAL